MKVNVRIKGGNKSSSFKLWSKEKILNSFERLKEHIKTIEAFFSDLNGPKGGRDQNLLIAVRLRNGKTIAVRTVDNDWGRALDMGVDRTIHTMTRHLERIRDKRRIILRKTYKDDEEDSLNTTLYAY